MHYNSCSTPLDPRPGNAEFYAAYRRFARLLREERYMLRIHLQDEDLVVFDNQWILHGRTAFTSTAFARHLRGCYLTRDSVYGAAALLERAAAAAARGAA